MCKCTPEVRTPFCGKPGCEWPPQQPDPRELARVSFRASVAKLPTDEGAAITAVIGVAALLIRAFSGQRGDPYTVGHCVNTAEDTFIELKQRGYPMREFGL